MKLLSFNSWRVYICQDASCKRYRRSWWFFGKHADAVGFGYELRVGLSRKLYGLLCNHGEVYFLEQGRLFNVTADEWVAKLEDIGSIRRRFVLRNGDQVAVSVEFRDYSKASFEDPEQHFFGEVVHWLSSTSLKSSFVQYWRERGKGQEMEAPNRIVPSDQTGTSGNVVFVTERAEDEDKQRQQKKDEQEAD